MDTDKKQSFWQKLKDFFTISAKDLTNWKKEHYEFKAKSK